MAEKKATAKKTKTVRGWIVVDRYGKWEGGSPMGSKLGAMIEFRFYRADYNINKIVDWFEYGRRGYRPIKTTMTYEV